MIISSNENVYYFLNGELVLKCGDLDASARSRQEKILGFDISTGEFIPSIYYFARKTIFRIYFNEKKELNIYKLELVDGKSCWEESNYEDLLVFLDFQADFYTPTMEALRVCLETESDPSILGPFPKYKLVLNKTGMTKERYGSMPERQQEIFIFFFVYQILKSLLDPKTPEISLVMIPEFIREAISHYLSVGEHQAKLTTALQQASISKFPTEAQIKRQVAELSQACEALIPETEKAVQNYALERMPDNKSDVLTLINSNAFYTMQSDDVLLRRLLGAIFTDLDIVDIADILGYQIMKKSFLSVIQGLGQLILILVDVTSSEKLNKLREIPEISDSFKKFSDHRHLLDVLASVSLNCANIVMDSAFIPFYLNEIMLGSVSSLYSKLGTEKKSVLFEREYIRVLLIHNMKHNMWLDLNVRWFTKIEWKALAAMPEMSDNIDKILSSEYDVRTMLEGVYDLEHLNFLLTLEPLHSRIKKILSRVKDFESYLGVIDLPRQDCIRTLFMEEAVAEESTDTPTLKRNESVIGAFYESGHEDSSKSEEPEP